MRKAAMLKLKPDKVRIPCGESGAMLTGGPCHRDAMAERSAQSSPAEGLAQQGSDCDCSLVSNLRTALARIDRLTSDTEP